MAVINSSNKSLGSALPIVPVLEIPAPVWIAFYEKVLGTAPDRVKRKLQERAYNSPIWYTP